MGAQIVKSVVIGKLNYALPLLINSTNVQLEKLNTIINKSCRVIIGSPCLKWSASRLQNKCKINNILQLIIEQSLNFIHKIRTNNEPETITELYKQSRNHRRVDHKLYTAYTPKTNLIKRFLINKVTEIYNNIDTEIT